MYAFAYDRETSTLVGSKAGAPCTGLDYERIVHSTIKLVSDAPPGVIAAFALVVEPGQPAPSPMWRKRLAEARDIRKPFRYAVISKSNAERGAVTAMHWIRPPSASQRVVWHASFPEGVVWLEAECGPRPILHTLYADVRHQLAVERLMRTG